MELPNRLVGCAGCRYLDTSVPCCVYILLTGHPRPSKPKPHGGCDSKDLRALDRKAPPIPKSRAPKEAAFPGGCLDGNEMAEGMYAKGASDVAIAKACHVSTQTVYRWRKATGRPSNQKGRENPK